MRHPLLALLLAAPLATLAEEPLRPDAAPRRGYLLTPGAQGVGCSMRIGPNDRVAQDGDLVVPAGAVVEVAAALRGSVVVARGARVQKAVAAGGSVRVEGGAVVEQEAVALSGDVRIEGGGRVGGDAISIGGQVRILKGGQVGGDVTSLALQLGGFSLAQSIVDGLVERGPCEVEVAAGER